MMRIQDLVLEDERNAAQFSPSPRPHSQREKAEPHKPELVLVDFIAETTPDFVATIDVHGHVLYLNPTARRWLGLRDDEPLPHIADAHPIWANAIVLGEGIETAILDGAWRGETCLLTRAGREIPVSEAIIAHTGRGGRCDFLTLVARDITELKRTETALRQSEQFYRRIVETADIGIWLIDPENRVAFANAKMVKLLGGTVEELTGQPLANFMAGVTGETHPPGVKNQREFKLRRMDGNEFWATLATRPLYDNEERYIGVLGMVVGT
ncbi:MAG: PAS domain S-box protein [Chloroflexi bacterium]|nr:PAS domain S-box protein [Chloroflexota bacterium]